MINKFYEMTNHSKELKFNFYMEQIFTRLCLPPDRTSYY